MSLPDVTEDFPFGEDVLVFRTEGKIFLLLWLGEGDLQNDMNRVTATTIAIKLPPEMNLELREAYDAVSPAYHMNKKHWSDIDISRFANGQVEEWVKISYDLVRPKRKSRK